MFGGGIAGGVQQLISILSPGSYSRSNPLIRKLPVGRTATNSFYRNWVFSTNSNFLIRISLQLNCVNLLKFQAQNVWSIRIHGLNYQRSETLGCKDIGIIKSEFEAKTLFLYILRMWRSNVDFYWNCRFLLKQGSI